MISEEALQAHAASMMEQPWWPLVQQEIEEARMAEEGYTEYEIELDDELYAEIQVFAETAGITVNEWCSHAVRTYLASLVDEEENDG